MAEEELDLELEEDNINKVEKRIKTLSEKVKLTSEERDELKGLNTELTTQNESISKERDFYKDFSKVSTKHPNAGEFQDKIWEKVKQGYDVEDATVAILNKEGKLNPPVVEKESAAGGSADTSLKNDDKTPDKMTQEERFTALKELEAKGEFNL